MMLIALGEDDINLESDSLCGVPQAAIVLSTPVTKAARASR